MHLMSLTWESHIPDTALRGYKISPNHHSSMKGDMYMYDTTQHLHFLSCYFILYLTYTILYLLQSRNLNLLSVRRNAVHQLDVVLLSVIEKEVYISYQAYVLKHALAFKRVSVVHVMHI